MDNERESGVSKQFQIRLSVDVQVDNKPEKIDKKRKGYKLMVG